MCTDDAARRELDAPIEREKASCACFDAEYGPTAIMPAIETTFTTCEPSPRPRQERERRPDRAEVVDAQDALDRLGCRVEVVAARADAGVVHEQVDARVPREHARRSRVDGLAVGDVALLVLVGRRRTTREADDERPASLQRTHELGADARARAGDDRYLQILICRAAAALWPAASVTIATR